jgi:hypothetical protein
MEYGGRLIREKSASNSANLYDRKRDEEFKLELKKAQESIEMLGMKRRSYKKRFSFQKKNIL